MKKIWYALAAMAIAIGLTACSAEEKSEPEKKESEEVANEPAVNPKKSLYKLYVSLVKSINDADAELNAYLGEEEPTAEMKTAASESAAKVAANIENLEIPAELKDQQADLEAAFKDIADSYLAKAEELKKDAPALDATEETFTQGVEKLGAAFESLEMNKPNLSKEIN